MRASSSFLLLAPLCSLAIACGSSNDFSDPGDELDADDTGGATDGAGDGATIDTRVAVDSNGTDTGASSDTALADTGATDGATDATTDGATDGATDATTDGATDGTPTDTTDAPTDTAPPTDGGCPALVLGGATEDVYVDKSVTTTGNGTHACPFKTILAATSLAAPGAASRRTIHVMGNAGAPDYSETAPIFVHARVTLTSSYDATSPGGLATVRIVARGDCTSFTGAASTTFCSVAMENDATLEKVTVRVNTSGGVTTGNGVATTIVVPSAGAAPPTILDTLAENAPESGIRIYGSAIVGPRVAATGNRNGLTANRAVTAPQATIKVNDAPTLSGAPSNDFSRNTNNGGGNGFAVFGDYVVTVDGMTAANNTFNGIVIGVPYTATSTVKQTLGNVHADNNGQNGMRIIGGEVHVVAGTVLNTFNNNSALYGIQATTGDAIGNVKLVLEPKRDSAGTGYVVAHQANGNHLGGIHLNNATPTPATSAHQLASLEAKTNGSATTGSGVYVEIVGATGPNQSSLELRGCTLIGNTGAGLRFQKGSTNTLDIGTAATGAGQGQNVFGAALAASNNTKSGVCYENLKSPAVSASQLAEFDRWSVLVCPPAPSSLGTGACGSNTLYADITYTTATNPFAAITSCF